MCYIPQPAEGKIHVYFHASVNPENSLSQVIICTVYLSFYTDSMASWLLISLVYGLCELNIFLILLCTLYRCWKQGERVGWGHTCDRGQRGDTTVGNYAQLRWLKKVQINFSRALTLLAVNSVVKGTKHKYFLMNTDKGRLKKLPK